VNKPDTPFCDDQTRRRPAHGGTHRAPMTWHKGIRGSSPNIARRRTRVFRAGPHTAKDAHRVGSPGCSAGAMGSGVSAFQSAAFVLGQSAPHPCVISGCASFGVTVLLRCHWSCRFNVWLGRANGWHRHRRPGVGDERRGLGDRELGVHPGGVVVWEVADKFILPGRQSDGYPA
jgi:hypothetical protein